MDGVLKFDTDESPHCVYNEAVGVRLAQTLHSPIADGVLTASGDGIAFVSLYVASVPDNLPNLHWARRKEVAAKYPAEVAALVAFDIFVGNWDRFRNVKASIKSPSLHLFRGFDHSHALLGTATTAEDSLIALNSNHIIATRHPFFGLVDLGRLAEWAQRIAGSSDFLIAECCQFRRDFRSVRTATQSALAAALNVRKRLMPSILSANTQHISTFRAKEEG